MSARPHMAKKSHIVVGLSVLAGLSLIAAVFGTNHVQAPSPAAVKTTAVAVDKHDVLGASVTADSYKIDVTKFDQAPTDTTTQTQRITVGVHIANTSPDVLQVSPGLQMSITDTTGATYPATARYLADDQIVGGPINPGEAADLSVDFELPGNAKLSELVFQKDASATPSKVKL